MSRIFFISAEIKSDRLLSARRGREVFKSRLEKIIEYSDIFLWIAKYKQFWFHFTYLISDYNFFLWISECRIQALPNFGVERSNAHDSNIHVYACSTHMHIFKLIHKLKEIFCYILWYMYLLDHLLTWDLNKLFMKNNKFSLLSAILLSAMHIVYHAMVNRN